MVEALLCCVFGLGIGYSITHMCLVVVEYYYEQEKVCVLLCTSYFTVFDG